MNTDIETVVISVLHPTDFSEASNTAFEHALAISTKAKSSLSILHVENKDFDKPDWRNFPHVRTTLNRWGLIKENSTRESVFSDLGIKIQKVEIKSGDAVTSIVKFAEKHPTDLIVLATHHNGLPGWMRGSVSEPVSRECRKKTIFVPELAGGFVSGKGHINIENILIPVDFKPNPLSAIKFTVDFAKTYSDSESVNIFLLHVGDSIKLDKIDMFSDEKINVSKEIVSGNVIDEIIKKANTQRADLIVMPTHGHDGFLDILRGSTTERILHHAKCPVLAYPTF